MDTGRFSFPAANAIHNLAIVGKLPSVCVDSRPAIRLSNVGNTYGGHFAMTPNTCKQCGKAFSAPFKSNKLYCSDVCRVRSWQGLHPSKPRGKTGRKSGFVVSEETKKKISQATRGRTCSEETKAKLREAANRHWQDERERGKLRDTLLAARDVFNPVVREHYLYQYINRITGKSYIGVTVDLKRREADHRNGTSSGRAFRDAIAKYGWENFERKVLAIFGTADIASYFEREAIIRFGTLSPNGYNLVAGAPHTHYNGTPSEETRAKLREANRRRETENADYLARKEARKAATQERKALKRAELERRKQERQQRRLEREQAKPGKGWQSLPEYKERFAEQSRQRWADPEFKARVSAAQREGKRKANRPRKPLTEEHRANISKAAQAHMTEQERQRLKDLWTPEKRAEFSAKAKARWTPEKRAEHAKRTRDAMLARRMALSRDET